MKQQAGGLLVTGASGFTGAHLIHAAGLAGWRVGILTADLRDRTAVRAQVAEFEPNAIVHLAAISAVTHADTDAFYQVNVIGTDNLLGAALKGPTKPSKIILASSANVYGNETSGLLKESAKVQPANHYGISKLAMEHVAGFYKRDLPIVITRAFNYTGVGHDERFVIPKLVEHFRARKPLVEVGNIDVEREFNDVRFVVQVYLQLLRSGIPNETYNVCSGRVIRLRHVILLLEKLSGHKIDIKVNPSFLRNNEIPTLGGSPIKLGKVLGTFKDYKLEETLQWMLDQ